MTPSPTVVGGGVVPAPSGYEARGAQWRFLLVVPLVLFLAGGVIVAISAWRAVSFVRPPRIPVDAGEVKLALPESEEVSFLGQDGVVLSGTYVAPHNGAAVALVHGLFANRLQLLGEAQVLVADGYGVLLFDNRAHGNSGGSVATWGQLESQDTSKAIDYLVQRTQLARGKIGLLGLSIGGTAVLREATGDPRVGAVVVEATYSSVAGEIRQMYGRWGPLSEWPALWVGHFVGGMNYSELVPEDLLCPLGSRPLLLVYGSGDSDVPISQGQRMSAAACRPEPLYVVPTTEHGGYTGSLAADAYSQRLLSFFGSALLN